MPYCQNDKNQLLALYRVSIKYDEEYDVKFDKSFFYFVEDNLCYKIVTSTNTNGIYNSVYMRYFPNISKVIIILFWLEQRWVKIIISIISFVKVAVKEH